MKWEIKDGVTAYRFEGVKLAESSSYEYNKSRWVEYTLFKASTGQWIWSRIGKSTVYHSAECGRVSRNRLSMVGPSELPHDATPCDDCTPSRFDPEGLYPERDKPKAQVCDTAEIVLTTLHQKDKNSGALFLTNVVKDLLAEASEVDPEIYSVYMVRTLG